MKNWKITVSLAAVFILLILGQGLLIAETADFDDLNFLVSLSYSDEAEFQQRSLDYMERQYSRTGELDEESITALIHLSQYGTLNRTYDKGVRNIHNFNIQNQAIALLARIGGVEASDSFSLLLTFTEEEAVIYELLESVPLVETNEYRDLMNSLGTLMQRRHRSGPDNGFALAALNSVEGILKKPGIMLTGKLVDMMVSYISTGYNNEVQSLAKDLIKQYGT